MGHTTPVGQLLSHYTCLSHPRAREKTFPPAFFSCICHGNTPRRDIAVRISSLSASALPLALRALHDDHTFVHVCIISIQARSLVGVGGLGYDFHCWARPLDRVASFALSYALRPPRASGAPTCRPRRREGVACFPSGDSMARGHARPAQDATRGPGAGAASGLIQTSRCFNSAFMRECRSARIPIVDFVYAIRFSEPRCRCRDGLGTVDGFPLGARGWPHDCGPSLVILQQRKVEHSDDAAALSTTIVAEDLICVHSVSRFFPVLQSHGFPMFCDAETSA